MPSTTQKIQQKLLQQKLIILAIFRPNYKNNV